MNHATRFHFANKFCRKNKNEFCDNLKFDSNYTNVEFFKKIGIDRVSILKFIKNEMRETDRLKDALKTFSHVSPVELNLERHENFFKKYASNYEVLKRDGYFG